MLNMGGLGGHGPPKKFINRKGLRLEITLDPAHLDEVPLLTELMAAAFDADAPDDPTFDRQLLACYHSSDFFQRCRPAVSIPTPTSCAWAVSQAVLR